MSYARPDCTEIGCSFVWPKPDFDRTESLLMMFPRGTTLNPKTRSPWRPRADWSREIDRSYPRVMRGLSRLPQKKKNGGSKSNCAYRFLCTGHFHGATERFDWFIASQRGDSPIDLLITSRTDNFPLFARPRKESYGFDTPKKVAKVQRLCQDSVQSQD